MSPRDSFSSIDDICEQLRHCRYITDQSLATVLYLSYHLHKPIFLEGEPGVGKTEVALVLSELLDARLIRLQCYEGLDAGSALYEWNYPKQLLRIKMDEQCSQSPEEIGQVIYTEPYLIKRPLLEAIMSSQGNAPVLLNEEKLKDDAFSFSAMSAVQRSAFGGIKIKNNLKKWRSEATSTNLQFSFFNLHFKMGHFPRTHPRKKLGG